LFVSLSKNDLKNLDEGLFRHIVLNALRKINLKFKSEYGNIVIASDSKKYWRREAFPYYKASRKQKREESDFDWKMLFEHMNKIKNEIRESFPYKYIEVEGAEADDIIATLCKHFAQEPIMIVSGDKDYIQLHTDNIKQYDPVHSKFVKIEDPKEYLFEHIIRGDSGDGIPNIASPDNCFVLGQRQKRITQKMMDSFRNMKEDHPLYSNYERNKLLIDLSNIPENIKTNIIRSYESQTIRLDKNRLMMYFSSHKLRTLLESLNDF
jgi:hypothetical protein